MLKSKWMSKNYWEIDHRDIVIKKRLEKIDCVIPIISGKGGVGKSMIATTMSILIAKEGRLVGLLDADLYSSSSSFMLETKEVLKENTHGLIPPSISNVKVMSISLFTGEKPVPLGGKATREVIKEILTITEWGRLNYLIVDMPPGTGDIMMILIETIGNKAKPIIITTPFKPSILTAKKAIELLSSARIPIIGIIENMSTLNRIDEDIELISRGFGVKLIGRIPIDMGAVEAINKKNISMLIQTNFANSILNLLRETGLI